MNFRLEAFSPPEGVGIVRVDGRFRLIRPPYFLRDSSVVSEDSISEVITKHGFSASSKEFESWEEVINFLNDQVVEARIALGQEIPDSVDINTILDVAPPAVLQMFMDRVANELIPQRMFTRAEEVLIALLTNEKTNQHLELVRRAAGLLRFNRERQQAVQNPINAIAGNDRRFTSLNRHRRLEATARVAEAIRMRGCFFAPTS